MLSKYHWQYYPVLRVLVYLLTCYFWKSCSLGKRPYSILNGSFQITCYTLWPHLVISCFAVPCQIARLIARHLASSKLSTTCTNHIPSNYEAHDNCIYDSYPRRVCSYYSFSIQPAPASKSLEIYMTQQNELVEIVTFFQRLGKMSEWRSMKCMMQSYLSLWLV